MPGAGSYSVLRIVARMSFSLRPHRAAEDNVLFLRLMPYGSEYGRKRRSFRDCCFHATLQKGSAWSITGGAAALGVLQSWVRWTKGGSLADG